MTLLVAAALSFFVGWAFMLSVQTRAEIAQVEQVHIEQVRRLRSEIDVWQTYVISLRSRMEKAGVEVGPLPQTVKE